MTESLIVFQLLLGEAALLTALLLLISGIDDLLIDLAYFARSLWPRLTVYRCHARADVESLVGRVAPAPIAIFIPAWDESAVIGAMLRHLTATLDYPAYRVFIGLYPNDPDGQATVAVVAACDPRLQVVRCARSGSPARPTASITSARRSPAMKRAQASASRRLSSMMPRMLFTGWSFMSTTR